MTEFNLDIPESRAQALLRVVAAKITERPKVDNQGRRLDNDRSQKLYHYDEAGKLTNVETVTTPADDDAA